MEQHELPRANRRVAFSVDRNVRRLFLATWGLGFLVVGLFAALGILLARTAPRVSAPASGALFLGIGVASFLLVVCALSLAIYAAVHVHRVRGAAFHICRQLRGLAESRAAATETERLIELRPGDYLQDVAQEINRTAVRLGCREKASDPSA